jgi:hypothetical protein
MKGIGRKLAVQLSVQTYEQLPANERHLVDGIHWAKINGEWRHVILKDPEVDETTLLIAECNTLGSTK